jgi:hypothetical protein
MPKRTAAVSREGNFVTIKLGCPDEYEAVILADDINGRLMAREDFSIEIIPKQKVEQ